jgi:hypothetical protein
LKNSPDKRSRADEELIKDLNFVRSFFAEMKMAEIVKLIDTDIDAVTHS